VGAHGDLEIIFEAREFGHGDGREFVKVDDLEL
jgi:hypothetical protein